MPYTLLDKRRKRDVARTKWDRVKRTNHCGKAIEARVVLELDDGLVMSVVGCKQATAFLPGPELKWAQDHQIPGIPVNPRRGDYVKAAVRRHDEHHRRLVLSLEDLQQGAVIEFLSKVNCGDTVTGKVIGTTRSGTWVELEAAAKGFIPAEEIPVVPGFSDPPLQPDDLVDCAVMGKDLKARTLKLTLMTEFASSQAKPDAGRESPDSSPDKASLSVAAPAVPVSRKATQTRRVLLADDNDILRTQLGRELRALGHVVQEAQDLSEARKRLLSGSWDCMVAHLHLDPERGAAALLELVREFRIQTILTLGLISAEEIELIDSCSSLILNVFLKPYNVEDMLTQVATLEPADEFALDAETDEMTAPAGLGIDAAVPEEFASLDRQRSIERVGADLHHAFLSDVVLIFERYGPARDGVRLAYCKNVNAEVVNPLLRPLRRSFLNEVLFPGHMLERSLPPGDACSEFLHPAGKRVFLLAFPARTWGQPRCAVLLFRTAQGNPSGERRCFAEEEKALIEALSMHLGFLVERADFWQRLVTYHTLISAGNVVSGLAHELRNALAALSHVGHYLKDLSTTGASSEFLRFELASKGELITRQCVNVASVIETFLGIGKGQQIARMPLDYVIRQVANLVQPEAISKGIDLTVDVDPRLSQFLFLEHMVMHILTNLLGNAVYHCGISHKVSKKISIEATLIPASPRRIRMLVRDNANGIHTADMNRIFEPFVTTRKGGTGLGLHICSVFAGLLGGKVCMEKTRVFGGTTFAVELPVPEVKSDV